jgi:hypothetical protein
MTRNPCTAPERFLTAGPARLRRMAGCHRMQALAELWNLVRGSRAD